MRINFYRHQNIHGLKLYTTIALNFVPTIFSKNVYESDSEDLNFLLSQLNAQ